MHHRFFGLAIIFLLMPVFLLAQDAFHRDYPAVNASNILCISAAQIKDGNYVSLELQDNSELTPQTNDSIIITKYKPKGDVIWSKTIKLTGTDQGFIPTVGSILGGENDSIYFAMVTKNDRRSNKILGCLSNNGVVVWLRSYSFDNSSKIDSLASGHLIDTFNRTLYTAHSTSFNAANEVLLSRKNFRGQNIFSLTLNATSNTVNQNEQLTHLSTEKDSTLLLAGFLDAAANRSFLMVADTVGQVIWSRSYRSVLGDLNVYDAIRLPDSTYILSGNLQNKQGFIFRTNQKGELIWGKRVSFSLNDTTSVKRIILDASNQIVLFGTTTEKTSNTVYHFACKLDLDGNVIWKNKFTKVQANMDDFGALFSVRSGGSAIFTTTKRQNTNLTSIIRLNNSGSTTCQDSIQTEIFFDEPFLVDTLVWTSTASELKLNNEGFLTNQFNYNIPTLSLGVRPFCPNEPIDFTFRATTKGATFYNWNTGVSGPTLDTLRVFEEGIYSVTVTIGEGVCYILCDTAMLTRFKEPGVGIGLSIGNFCTTGLLTLNTDYTPGAGFRSITWSTGATTRDIEIAQPGTYSVTVVDDCLETATDDIVVGPFPTKVSQVGITDDVVVNCANNTVSGNLSATANTGGFPKNDTYLWSTGATGASITLDNESAFIYTVTVTDICGNTASNSIVIEKKGDGLKTVEILISKVQCNLNLNALTNPSIRGGTYLWSNNATSSSITIPNEVASFTVTVTDVCQNTAIGTYTVIADSLAGELKYATLFFPDDMGYVLSGDNRDSVGFEALVLNRTFGPIRLPEYCLEEIESYELYIFNRWGQQVFESKKIDDEWNGRFNDKKSPSDTYIWLARYKVSGVEKKAKGDITLLRP